MAKPKTAGPTFLLRSDQPGDPYSLIDSIGHNAARAGSIGLADAAGRAAQAFLSWKKGQPGEEWLVTCDRISADRLATWAHRLEPIDATLCAEVRAVVEEMRQFLRLPAPGPSSTPSIDPADDHSIRIGQCTCEPGRSCQRCLQEEAHRSAIIREAEARRASLQVAERQQEEDRQARRLAIAEQREQRRQERRASITVPTLFIEIPGKGPLPVWLNRLDDSGDVEACTRTVAAMLRCLTLAQLPGIPEVHARLHVIEVVALRRELAELGAVDEAA